MSKALGVAAVVGGAALAGLGIFLATRKPKTDRRQLEGPARRPASTVAARRNGMTTRHYRKEDMPLEERVAILQEQTAKAVKDPEMRKLALAITGKGGDVVFGTRRIHVEGANCPQRDGRCELRAIYDWKRKNLRYTGDIGTHKLEGADGGGVEGVDLFQTPQRTIEFGGGDCDDASQVGASLAILNGMPAKLVVTSPNRSPRSGDDWTHIYEMANIGPPKNGPDKWVAIDSTLPGDYFGVEAPSARRREFIA